jgi:hypothetical protein
MIHLAVVRRDRLFLKAMLHPHSHCCGAGPDNRAGDRIAETRTGRCSSEV